MERGCRAKTGQNFQNLPSYPNQRNSGDTKRLQIIRLPAFFMTDLTSMISSITLISILEALQMCIDKFGGDSSLFR